MLLQKNNLPKNAANFVGKTYALIISRNIQSQPIVLTDAHSIVNKLQLMIRHKWQTATLCC
jgi:hypothetical protein